MQRKLPSGAEVSFRPYTVKDMNLLNSSLRREQVGITKLLAACTTDFQPGEISVYKGGIDWKAAPVADRVVATLILRATTYPGGALTPTVRCPVLDCRAVLPESKAFFPVEQILADNVIDFGDEVLRKLARGDNRFEGEAFGIPFAFKIATGEDAERSEERVLKAKTSEARRIRTIASRIVELRGKTTRRDIEDELADLGMKVVDEILVAMDVVEAGVETLVKVECEKCDWEFDFNLPLGGTEFWISKASKISQGLATRTRKAIRDRNENPESSED